MSAPSALERELEAVSREGWDGAASVTLVNHLRKICRSEASRWLVTAGSLGDEGLSAVWAVADQLLRSGRIDLADQAIRVAARRAYAAEAAASQTGMGGVGTKGLVRHARTHQPRRSLDGAMFESECTANEVVLDDVPGWMKALAVRLARAGWSWRVPPLWALAAAVSCGSGAGRKERSPLAGHDTGVPAATWATLQLLSLGSGPGCRTSRRWPGSRELAADHGLDVIRKDAEIDRLVHAAVDGRPVRTGRLAAEAASA